MQNESAPAVIVARTVVEGNIIAEFSLLIEAPFAKT